MGPPYSSPRFEKQAPSLYFMFWMLGLTYAKWGALGMLNTEALFALLAAGLFFGVYVLLKKGKGF